MSSFAFGMILIGAGVVVYGLNHLLKPEAGRRTQKTLSGGLKTLIPPRPLTVVIPINRR